MKIIVSEEEIKNAILDRLTAQGIVTEGRDKSIAFTTSRKNNGGVQATVELIDRNLPSIPTGNAEEDDGDVEDQKPAPAGILQRKSPISAAPVITNLKPTMPDVESEVAEDAPVAETEAEDPPFEVEDKPQAKSLFAAAVAPKP